MKSRERRLVSLRMIDSAGRMDELERAGSCGKRGLLDATDWRAQLVGPPAGASSRLPLVRRQFDVDGEVRRARLYISAHGVFEAEINGQPVSADILAPGWQSYRHRRQYLTYDVTAHIEKGANAIGVKLGDGWFRGRLGFLGQRELYGETIAVQAQLELTFASGAREVISTDNSWSWAPGPIIASDLYDGESYDASYELPGWSSADAGGLWRPVVVLPADPAELVAPTGPPVRATMKLSPARVFTSRHGKTLIDFGQNIVGRVRISTSALSGHENHASLCRGARGR